MPSDHGLNNYRSSCDWPLVLTLEITSTCLRRYLVVWVGCCNSQRISGDIYERAFLTFIMNQVWCNSCTNVLRCVRLGIVPQERYRLSPQILTSIDSILEWRPKTRPIELSNRMKCCFGTEQVVTIFISTYTLEMLTKQHTKWRWSTSDVGSHIKETS